MQTQPFPESDGRKCWLSRNEQQRLRTHYQSDVQKQLAVDLGLHGLRSAEIIEITKDDVRQLDVDAEAYALQIKDGKTQPDNDHNGWRETPLRADTRQTMEIYANASQKRAGEPLIDVTKRTIRRWVKKAARSNIESDNAEFVGPHDLRRSWATDAFWSLGGGSNVEVAVMNWGGWALTDTGRNTFRTHYLGSVPDHVSVELQREAGLA